MDKLSGLASKLGGKGSHSSSNSGSAGQEDYVDKALGGAEKKFGGGKVDPAKMRSTNEKITDTGREQFEKATGKHVPEKFSN
ncbi:hypothetical protein PENARI_c016G11383 [Penicillium arizonense]|uniref:Uncharacterized protein n=1 Tax=Penicillium arizonense TaxID=1835702 RepID=A0A1F5LBP1_PENAI|nr:hypothetical protein PENARI_c016G11383 [Penicillium arizonense]KAJ6082827.1 hypothetical protein N7467_006962 [Penicillium canescens]OGE50653.1 hypothetical protein PENARI_c016G11383 [Penicillium arizonense]